MEKIFSNAKGISLIVGAGASKGARIEGSLTPPLDTEFIRLAKSLLSKRKKNGDSTLLQKGKDEWKNFESTLMDIGLSIKLVESWRLEELATYLEARANVTFQKKAGRKSYADILKRLNRIICYVLTLSGGTKVCEIHKTMIERVDPQSIISFNYDLILDETLINLEKLKWATASYIKAKTIKLLVGNKIQPPQKWYSSKKRPQNREGIPLYKLHGSIHWEAMQRGDGHTISGVTHFPPKNKTFGYERPPETPFIIPPVAAKMSIEDKHLKHIWTAAKNELIGTNWIIWGYSFPRTDTITSVLLKTCLQGKRGQKKPVIVINPDPSVSGRIEELLSGVKVIAQYSTATDFFLKKEWMKLVKKPKNSS